MPSTGNFSILFALKRLAYISLRFWRLTKRTITVGCLLTGLPVVLGLSLGICCFGGKRCTIEISSSSFERTLGNIFVVFQRNALKLKVLISIVPFELANFQFVITATFTQIIR